MACISNSSLATLSSSQLLPVLLLLRQISLQCTLVCVPTINQELFRPGHLFVHWSNNVALHVHHTVDDLLIVLDDVVVDVPEGTQKLGQLRALFVEDLLDDKLAVEAQREEAGVDDSVIEVEEDGE